MKKIYLLSAIIFMSWSAMAQVQRNVSAKNGDSVRSYTIDSNQGKQGKKGMKAMVKELDLTKLQKGQFKELNKSSKEKKAAIEANANLSDAEKKTMLQTLRREQLKKTMLILTPEQREKMKKLRGQQKKGEMEEMMDEDQ